MTVRIINADVMAGLSQLADESVNCVVTSPPYWGLRDYGTTGQIGLEPTPDEFVARIVEVFREVRRVLRADGTLWLNLGDTYHNADKWGGGGANTGKQTRAPNGEVVSWQAVRRKWSKVDGLKPKDLIGIPWRVALALQADGWWLRSDIVWSKPNAMPENVSDRPTKAHEYLFLLTKAERYFYDADAIREPHSEVSVARVSRGRSDDHKWSNGPGGQTLATDISGALHPNGRNRRTVWSIPTHPYSGAHFATFPPELPELCIKAGCPPAGTVLDPFSGAGTTALVADRLQRNAIGIELNPEYAAMSERRINGDRGALLDLMEV